MLNQPPAAPHKPNRASKALDDLGLPYRISGIPGHTEVVSSLEEAASQRGQTPEQIIRSILFRLDKENFVMVLMAGPAQISWSALRSYLGQSRLTMASEEEVLTATGYRVGAVSPLGLPRQHEAARLPKPLRILADESVFLPEEISIGSGERGIAILLRSSDLRKALPDVEIGQFAA